MTADPGETPAATADAGMADLTLDARAAAADVPPELVAQSLGQYLRAWWGRVRGGNSGVLPVVLAIVVVAVSFQIANSKFLSAQNLVNLFEQSTIYMLLAIAEIFALLLGEIDLSVGLVMGLGSVVVAELVQPTGANWPWWAAIIVTLLACCRGRRHPGNARGPAEDAVVHRHSRRAADPGGRGDHRPRRDASSVSATPSTKTRSSSTTSSGGRSPRWSAGSCWPWWSERLALGSGCGTPASAATAWRRRRAASPR